jgi:hypothetical protein
VNGTIEVEAIWEEATPAERRVLVEDLVDAVVIHPAHLPVLVNGAPPLNVTLAEVGLRDPGTKTSVSEGGLVDLRHAIPLHRTVSLAV